MTHFNITLRSRPRSLNWSFFRYSHQTLNVFLYFYSFPQSVVVTQAKLSNMNRYIGGYLQQGGLKYGFLIEVQGYS